MKVCLKCQTPFDTADWQCSACGFTPQTDSGLLAFAPELASQNDGFTQDYFEQLIDLEADHFWFRARNRLIIWALQKHFPNLRSLLEVGCGTGFVLSGIRSAFPDITLAGSEIFTQGLNFAHQRLPTVTLFQMDARHIPFQQEFDVVGAFDVLEHIEQDEAVLHQLFQATKPGGGLILTVPQHQFLWSIVDERAFHKRRYSRQDLVQKLRRAGFAIARVTSFVSLLLPLMFLSRLRRQATQADYDPLAEYKISHTLNTRLEQVLQLEHRIIQTGFSFPAGGSLLVVAHRHE